MRGDLLGLKVYLELGISFRLDIVRDIFPSYGHDDLKVTGSSLGGIDREVDWLANGAGLDISHNHAAGVISLDYKQGNLNSPAILTST